MNREASLDAVRVDKEKLLEVLRTNREAHRALFEEAMEGYRIRAIEELEAHIERIKANKPERVAVQLPLPEDHTSDYDLTIDMVDWSLDDTIWLEPHDFNRYVRDEWSWKDQFLATAAAYTVTS